MDEVAEWATWRRICRSYAAGWRNPGGIALTLNKGPAELTKIHACMGAAEWYWPTDRMYCTSTSHQGSSIGRLATRAQGYPLLVLLSEDQMVLTGSLAVFAVRNWTVPNKHAVSRLFALPLRFVLLR